MFDKQLTIYFALLAVCSANPILENDTCINWELEEANYKRIMTECGYDFARNYTTELSETEIKKKYDEASLCTTKQEGVWEKDGVWTIVFETNKQHIETVIQKNKDEMLEAMDECANGEEEMKWEDFRQCYFTKLIEICPHDGFQSRLNPQTKRP